MRFAVSIILSTLFLSFAPAFAQHSRVDASEGRHIDRPALHIRNRSSRETVQVPEGLTARLFARQLGDISAIALDKDGAVYVTDQRRGRVYKLSDRSLDGKLDSTRIILRDLQDPSGLAVIADRLYVADARAVWTVPLSGGAKTQLASLANAKADPFPRPLMYGEASGALYLGLSSAQGTARVISINTANGQASLAAKGTGRVIVLARTAGDDIWIGTGNQLVPVSNETFNYARAVRIADGNLVTGAVLPGQFAEEPESFAPYQGHIFIAQGGKRQWQSPTQAGLNVLAVPTRFGQAADGRSVFADGFAARSGRSAWGQPGMMVMDARGLFITDRWSGSVWLVTSAPPKPAPVIAVSTPELAPDETSEPQTVAPTNPQGSLILKGSMIETGTSINIGSTIPDPKNDDDDESASKDKGKKIRSVKDTP